VKNIKCHTVGRVQKYNRKIVETEVKSIPLTHIHDLSFSWFDKDSSIKGGLRLKKSLKIPKV
jgi:hypothetical protein